MTTSPIRNDRPIAPVAPRSVEPEAAPAETPAAAPAQQPTGHDPRSSFEPAADTAAPTTLAPPSTASTREAVRSLEAATSTLTQAQRRRETVDRELGRRLAQYNEGLSPEQRQTYIDSYRRDHASVYDAERTAAEGVARIVREQGPELERAAASGRDGARSVANGLRALASSPEAATAVEFSARVLGGENAPAAANLRGQRNFERDVFERGIPNAAATLAARSSFDDARDVGQELSRMLSPLGTAGAQGYQFYQQAMQVGAGQTDAVANLARRFETASPLQRGMAMAGLVGGAVSGGMQLRNGNTMQALETLARTGQSGLELVSGATSALTQGTRFAMVGARAATMAARLAPGLGALASAASIGVNVNQLARTGNPGYAVSAVGDAVATLGSAIAAFPPAAVPGSAVAALGTAISAGGDFLANRIASRRSAAEERRHLQAAGLSPAVADRFVENPAGIRALAAQGQSPRQIQELAGQPNASSFLGRDTELRMTSNALRGMGVTDAQYSQFVRNFSGPELSALTMGLNNARGPGQARAYLEGIARESGFSDSAKQAIRELLQRMG